MGSPAPPALLGHHPPAAETGAFRGHLRTIVTALVIRFERINIAVDKEFFSFLGILLSLLLAFRTNTAYDRFYEGRRLWGQLPTTAAT